MPRKSKRRGPSSRSFVLNCNSSSDQNEDFTYEDAISAGVADGQRTIPESKDLRARWWRIDDQGRSGACVGYAAAYGVLRWHYVTADWLYENEKPSARFIWMANKETDDLTDYPTTFLESAGTQTKKALKIAHRYGCVEDDLLPMDGKLAALSRAAFYTKASSYRITSYHNLARDLAVWRRWIAFNGPILTRLDVDRTWNTATANRGELTRYQPDTTRGGHAVCIVGYTPEHFIVRNSWGTDWGDRGFAYASNAYAADAFTEAYGVVL